MVKILRELPCTVRLVCCRENNSNRVINTSQDRAAFEARNILGGSLKNLIPEQTEQQRLIKALSDTSVNTSSSFTGNVIFILFAISSKRKHVLLDSALVSLLLIRMNLYVS